MRPLKHIAAALALAAMVSATPARADGFNIIRDEEIEQSLKVMTKPIFEQAGLAPDSIRFVILENPELNAFVAGGQNIFLHTGLILETQNPAELVGVIAHETGHIAGGHLFLGATAASGLTLQAMLASVLGIAVGIAAHAPDAGIAASSIGTTITTRQFLHHTRTQEGSADQAGVRFLEGAHLPVTGFLSFMKKLESQELLPETQQSQYVMTHPLSQDRVDFLQHVVDTMPQGAMPDAWFELHRRMKAKLSGYLYPDRVLQKKSDDSIDGRYARAIALFRKGQPDDSLALIDGLIKAEPKNPYFHELDGQVLLDAGKVDKAAAAYQRAVTLAPFSGLIRIAYAHALIEEKGDQKAHLTEAVQQLQLALTREKQTSEPHYLLAIAYGKLGEEGLSRLHLAEEAMMQNKPDFAKREAELALTHLKTGTPAWLRAQDILNAVPDLKKQQKGD